MSKDISIDELGDFLEGIVGVTLQPDVADAMQATLGEVKADLTQGFLSGKAPDGSVWPPLKYPRPKEHNQENKPLIDTVGLMNSVVYQGTDHVEAVSGQGLVLGTYVEYASVHQEGSIKSNIPNRPFMGFSEKVLDTSAELTADSVINQINNL